MAAAERAFPQAVTASASVPWGCHTHCFLQDKCVAPPFCHVHVTKRWSDTDAFTSRGGVRAGRSSCSPGMASQEQLRRVAGTLVRRTAQRPQEVAVRPATAVTAGAELLDRMELGQAENSWWGSDTFLLRRWRILFLKILNSDIVRLQKKLRDVA